MISANVEVLQNKMISQVGSKDSYSPFGCEITCLAPNTPNQSLFQISKLQNYPEHKSNIIHTTEVISKLKILYSWRKRIRHVFFESESC